MCVFVCLCVFVRAHVFACVKFIIQALTLTTSPNISLAHGHEYVSRTFTLDWSFGMCLSKDLNALHRLAWTYLAPGYLLSMVLLSLLLSRFHQLNKIFGRSTCMKMLWKFVLLSFSSLTVTSFQLLKPARLHPDGTFRGLKFSNLRFADDPSYQYFSGAHLPWAIVGFTIVVLVCLPLPCALPFLHNYPFFKPFSDFYSSPYKENRHWWCSVDLLRRIILAVVYAMDSNPEREHLLMTQICFFLLFVQTLFWPFEKTSANIIETSLIFCLSSITLLGGPDMNWPRSVAIEALFFTSLFVLLVYLLWAEIDLKYWIKTRTRALRAGRQRRDHIADATMLRERLLADSPPPCDSQIA